MSEHGEVGRALNERDEQWQKTVAELREEHRAKLAIVQRHQAEDAKAICDVRPMDDEGYMRWMDRHSRVVARAAEIQRAREK